VERTVTAFSRVCLIGLGEVGQILADDLKPAGVSHLSAYDILFSRADSIPSRAAAARGLAITDNAAEAARGAELIVCAVTAAADLEAAQSVAQGDLNGAFYLDLNSASPGTKRRAAEIIGRANGRYVEAAVMTPFPPKRIASPMLLGGPHAEEFLHRATPLGFKAKIASREIGTASATKMCRSVMIKGIEALLMESMLAARHYGVERDVLNSLSDLLPVGDWEKLARYMISRSLEHGVRRAEEMREVAKTVAEAGVAPLMSRAAAERQDWAATHHSALSADSLAALLDSILREIAADGTGTRKRA
jgi:3-hydroxyisobutyrate dehydrogenase-like beta-hydroxyacid dehydrogenase